MKIITSLSVLLISFFVCIGCTDKSKPQLTDNIKSGLRQDAKEFMGSLKEILVKEMQTNGVAAAVSVCSDTAQLLTVNYGLSKGIYIKRVSFMNRNPNNMPDGFETEVLKSFELLNSQGKLTDTTDFFELIEEDGVYNVRYMKPILTQAPCLSCHGTSNQISDNVKTILQNKYQDDKATGYQLDDLRGAEKNKVKITPELINEIIAEAVKETNKELSAFKQIRKFHLRESEFEKTTTQKIKRYLVRNVS